MSNPINDYTFPLFALTKGRKVARLFDQQFGCIRIEDLWRPFFCVSTNLSAGTLAVHRDGPLAEALRASVSIPGLLPPVMMAGEAHVDGGIVNWLPVDVMGSQRGTVIAVDVASDPALEPLARYEGRPSFWQFLKHGRKVPPIVDLLVRSGTVGSNAIGRAARNHSSLRWKRSNCWIGKHATTQSRLVIATRWKSSSRLTCQSFSDRVGSARSNSEAPPSVQLNFK